MTRCILWGWTQPCSNEGCAAGPHPWPLPQRDLFGMEVCPCASLCVPAHRRATCCRTDPRMQSSPGPHHHREKPSKGIAPSIVCHGQASAQLCGKGNGMRIGFSGGKPQCGATPSTALQPTRMGTPGMRYSGTQRGKEDEFCEQTVQQLHTAQQREGKSKGNAAAQHETALLGQEFG